MNGGLMYHILKPAASVHHCFTLVFLELLSGLSSLNVGSNLLRLASSSGLLWS